jgi:hypothetical protein
MKHKGQYTTPQLKKLALQGHDVIPVFGRPLDMVTLRHAPRTKFDPKPWVWGKDGLRYSAWELTTEKHVATSGELAELRHEVEDTTAFVLANLACAGVGVAVPALA